MKDMIDHKHFIFRLMARTMLVAAMLIHGKGHCQTDEQRLAREILAYRDLETVYEKGLEILGTGFNAGTVYAETWIRDLNTFLTHSLLVIPREEVREALLRFFYFQGFDGNMIDGYVEIPNDDEVDYYATAIRYDMPGYAFHKNTVETDQETSLIQAIGKYIRATGDRTILEEEIHGMSVMERMELMLTWLMNYRYNRQCGLIWGATTADWGDVHPNHPWGVKLDETAGPAIDIYDNAMFLIALEDFMQLHDDPGVVEKWKGIYEQVRDSTRKHLWDEADQKFIPHIYLDCAQFEDIDERHIYYHGGTAVAILAGLLDQEEILASIHRMRRNVKEAGAMSIGLTLYPAYPEGAFMNKGMGPYQYQNGGDWTWFGARMITAMVRYGFVREAYEDLQPMVRRVIRHNGFFEWYTVDGKPMGAGIFRGSAGVLLEAIDALREWAKDNQGSVRP
jgi:glycogen debranching enzyme